MLRPDSFLDGPFRAAAVAIGIVSLLGVAPVAAAPTFQAYLYDVTNLAFVANNQGPEPPASINVDVWAGNLHTDAEAVAFPGFLAMQNTCTNYAAISVGRSCGTKFKIDDLVVTDGTGIAKPVTAYVRLDIRGLATYAGTGGNNVVGSENKVSVTLGHAQPNYQNLWAPTVGALSSSYPSSGFFTGINDSTVEGTFVAGPFNLTTESLNNLEIASSVMVAPYPYGGWIQGSTNLVVSFARAQPAIVLPVGFVANSSLGDIVNNWYTAESVDVPASEPVGPRGLVELGQNFPNPFSGETEIAYTLSKPGMVRLEVYSVTGRRIAEIEAGEKSAGRHAARWTGRDAQGRAVAPGVYFCSLHFQGERTTRRMLLVP